MAQPRHGLTQAVAAVVAGVEGRQGRRLAGAGVVAGVEGGGPPDVARVVVVELAPAAVTGSALIWSESLRSE